MKAWPGEATEEGTLLSPQELACQDGLPPPELDGMDFAILSAWTERKAWSRIASEVGLTAPAVHYRINRPKFQEALERIRRSWFDAIARGEFGAIALAKANAVPAMRRVVALARTATDERVRLNANLEILKLAGVQPPKPATIERPETILDLMTVEELAHFERTNEFPRRLGDKLARVASSVIQTREKTTVEAEIEDEMRHEAARAQHAESPDETPEDDSEEPAPWTQLPDESELDEA